MDIIGNLFLYFFGQFLMVLLLPFLLIAALAALGGGRPDRILNMGFALLETFIAGGISLVLFIGKIIKRLSAEKRPLPASKRKSPKSPTAILITEPDGSKHKVHVQDASL
ncbi:MAG: hypothetical protein K2W82_16415 [Candidatus Obscuribacterales bacterium]|nr:hypothetical protein [Candidatus Obscuribacterales bacterium]